MSSAVNFIIGLIYLMLPGIFANMAPIIVRKHFKLLATPLDLKKELNKKRILGDNKTYRGLIFGILFARFGSDTQKKPLNNLLLFL